MTRPFTNAGDPRDGRGRDEGGRAGPHGDGRGHPLGLPHLLEGKWSHLVLVGICWSHMVISGHSPRREEEARLRHRLGMALWRRGTGEDHDAAQGHFERAVSLFEAIRQVPIKCEIYHRHHYCTGWGIRLATGLS